MTYLLLLSRLLGTFACFVNGSWSRVGDQYVFVERRNNSTYHGLNAYVPETLLSAFPERSDVLLTKEACQAKIIPLPFTDEKTGI